MKLWVGLYQAMGWYISILHFGKSSNGGDSSAYGAELPGKMATGTLRCPSFIMSRVIYHQKQGGVRAVVAVDTIQVFIIVAGLIVLIVAGVYHEDVGGPSVVYDRLKETPRLDLDS